MAEPDGVVVYAGSYVSVADAKDDFELIRALHNEKFIGEFEAAVFHKDADGKVKVLDTVATERSAGAKVGAITGAVMGVLFPATIVGAALAGGGIGALFGNFRRGLKRKDVMEIGDMLDEGEAGVVLVGFTTIEEGVERLMKHAAKITKREIDATAEELKSAVDEVVGS